MNEARDLHELLCAKHPGVETLYEDTIIDCIGFYGLLLLKEKHMIEACAMFNGRKLYAI